MQVNEVKPSQRPRVTLEPELESEVCLLTPQQRLNMAIKLERWAHQLRISVKILTSDLSPRSKPSLKRLSQRRLILN